MDSVGGRRGEPVRAVYRRLQRSPYPTWEIALVVVANAFQLYAVLRVFDAIPRGTVPVMKDSVVFEYAGWLISTGGRLYIDLWEIKPPANHELLGVLALLSGGNVVLYHSFVLVLNVALVVGCAVAVGRLVYVVTEDSVAAFASGLVPFTVPQFFWRATLGYKSKYLVVAAGLFTLYFAARDRPFSAGLAGALAASTWQLALVFPVVAAIQTYVRNGRPALRRYFGGALLVTVVVLAPVLVWGAVDEMVAEVLLSPLLTTESHDITTRVQFVLRMHRRFLPVAILGVLGLLVPLASRDHRHAWPLPVVAAWFVGVMVFLDFDGYPDLFPWVAMVAIGSGVAIGYASLPSRSYRPVATSLVLFAALSVVTMGGMGTGNQGLTAPDRYDLDTELDPQLPYNASERQYVFWNQVPPETCRIFAGPTQFRLVNAANLSPQGVRYFEAPCGESGRIWQAVLDKYAPG